MVVGNLSECIYIQPLSNTQVNLFPVLSHNDERRLYRCREGEEREHDGEVLLLLITITLSHGPTE